MTQLLTEFSDRVQVCEVYANLETGDHQKWRKVLEMLGHATTKDYNEKRLKAASKLVRAQVEVNPLDGRLTNRKTGYNINKQDVARIEGTSYVKDAREKKEAVEDVKELSGM